MADIRPFAPVKLICGIIAGEDEYVGRPNGAWPELSVRSKPAGRASPSPEPDYYEPEMGPGLRRGFVSFRDLIAPDRLPDDQNPRPTPWRMTCGASSERAGRVVNLDPGISDDGGPDHGDDQGFFPSAAP